MCVCVRSPGSSISCPLGAAPSPVPTVSPQDCRAPALFQTARGPGAELSTRRAGVRPGRAPPHRILWTPGSPSPRRPPEAGVLGLRGQGRRLGGREGRGEVPPPWRLSLPCVFWAVTQAEARGEIRSGGGCRPGLARSQVLASSPQLRGPHRPHAEAGRSAQSGSLCPNLAGAGAGGVLGTEQPMTARDGRCSGCCPPRSPPRIKGRPAAAAAEPAVSKRLSSSLPAPLARRDRGPEADQVRPGRPRCLRLSPPAHPAHWHPQDACSCPAEPAARPRASPDPGRTLLDPRPCRPRCSLFLFPMHILL